MMEESEEVTLVEARRMRQELAHDIRERIAAFEEKTGLVVEGISVRRIDTTPKDHDTEERVSHLLRVFVELKL